MGCDRSRQAQHRQRRNHANTDGRVGDRVLWRLHFQILQSNLEILIELPEQYLYKTTMLLVKHYGSFHAPRNNKSLLRVSSVNADYPKPLITLHDHVGERICD